ncbi:hypothetical protein D3C77_457220 [compost metagenome]
MDIVTNAGAVGRAVITTKDGDRCTAAGSGLKDQWNQVGFRFMAFAQLPVRVSTGGVEVAQAHRLQPVGMVEVLKYLLHHPLAAPIRIDRRLGVFFVDRHILWIAIDGCARGEYQRADPGADHGL